ncbi:MAG: chromate efflux transporter [Actinobacteria bacterium]|nr:chromate efflux transporter [Actinomycetota bacterium]
MRPVPAIPQRNFTPLALPNMADRTESDGGTGDGASGGGANGGTRDGGGAGASAPLGGRLVEVLRLFGWLGVIGVGGPAAHIAMMRTRVVQQRGWVSDDEFARMVGACALVPGPNSTEMAMALGAKRAGWRGLVTGGVSFIVPAFLIVCAIGWVYEDVLTSATIADIRRWVVPVVAALVLDALWKLRTTAVRDVRDAVIVVLALVGAVVGVPELLVLAIVGAGSVALRARPEMRTTNSFLAPLVVASTVTLNVPLWQIFLVFLQIGSVIYGSGYVLLVFLDAEVVGRGWISSDVLLDAISVGQFTPGPVFTTATFIGWHLAGLAGAAVATLGIFGPSFVFAGLVDRVVQWSQRSKLFGAFLRGVSTGSIALMVVVLIRLADEAFVDWLAVAMFALSLAVIVGMPRWREARRSRVG